MKFTSSSSTWGRGITAVQNAVGSPISNPIVENIFVSCEGDRVRFLATNLNLTIRCEGEANVEIPGQIVLPKLITNIVRDLPKDDVFFEAENENVRIKCGRFNMKLKGQTGDLFPPFMALEHGEEIILEASVVKDIVRKTIFSTSPDKARYELDGVRFDLKDGILRCVATDGRRLAQRSVTGDSMPDITISALVPSKTLNEVQNALPDEGDVHIRIDERKVQFTCGDTTIISNLLKNNFPLYERIIPPEGNFKAIINRQDLHDSVKRISNIASAETGMVIMHVEQDHVDLLGEWEEVGREGKDFIAAEYNGEIVDIRYNYKFIQDVLRVVDEDQIEIDIKDAKKPGIFKGVGNDHFLYVLMPLRPPDEENPV